MFDVLSIAASGMRAADLRLQAAARNIANANAVGSLPNAVGSRETRPAYRPVEVAQFAVEGGGVGAVLRERSESHLELYSPSSAYADARGMVAAPNVDLAHEMTEVAAAELSFKANAMVVNTSIRMFDALMDAMEHEPDRDDRKRWRLTV